MLSLSCPVQAYSWGKVGNQSLVAKLKSSSDGNFVIENDKCYAELWMGTHPSGPAKLSEFGTDLSTFLVDNPSLCGTVPEGYLPFELAFLFKVLSVHTALSIQAHPDRLLAQQLHRLFPDIYKDGNHKPEMVIALTPFECLCGFRKPDEINSLLQAYPEFNRLLVDCEFKLDDQISKPEEEYLKQLFCAYANARTELVSSCLDEMMTRLRGTDEVNRSELDSLLLRLFDQYPGDIGVFAPLLLNTITLRPGESFFIGPNVPHAYLAGDCVECMALSDNVVRAGLTPKFKDVSTLTSMLSYRAGPPSFLTPESLSSGISLYRPPWEFCSEFEVETLTINAGQRSIFPAVPVASIMIVLGGDLQSQEERSAYPELSFDALNCTEASYPNCQKSFRGRTGSVLFVAAGAEIEIANESQLTSFIIFRAHVNLGG
jgi:mannose-6-phosphate isomerase